MFRKTLAHVMILLVICQVGAAWTVFSTAIWIHKQNKQARLSDTARWEQIVLTSVEFETGVTDDNEIEIEGQLYDIVSARVLNGMVTITAVADHAENKMKRTLSSLQHEENGWSEIAKRAQSFSMAVFHPEQNLRIFPYTFTQNGSYCHQPEKKLLTGFPGSLEQPPTA